MSDPIMADQPDKQRPATPGRGEPGGPFLGRVAAPVLSTLEDITSVVLSLLAILFPVLVILGVIGLVIGLVALFRRMRRRRRQGAVDTTIPEPPDPDRVLNGG